MTRSFQRKPRLAQHARYLRYVLLHKWYVFGAGLAVASIQEGWSLRRWIAWLWRLLIHDLSKFRPDEWRPYVEQFYGVPPLDVALQLYGVTRVEPGDRLFEPVQIAVVETKRRRKAAFDRAWLLHQHRNGHHWQHWVLREDSGATLVLMPHAWYVDEMVADWCAAGPKVLDRPSLAGCVAETILWYTANADKMVLREPVRARVEQLLLGLADLHGLTDAAQQIQAAHATVRTITLGGRG